MFKFSINVRDTPRTNRRKIANEGDRRKHARRNQGTRGARQLIPVNLDREEDKDAILVVS